MDYLQLEKSQTDGPIHEQNLCFNKTKSKGIRDERGGPKQKSICFVTVLCLLLQGERENMNYSISTSESEVCFFRV